MLKARTDGRLVIALSAKDIDMLMDGHTIESEVEGVGTVVVVYGGEQELNDVLELTERPQ